MKPLNKSTPKNDTSYTNSSDAQNIIDVAKNGGKFKLSPTGDLKTKTIYANISATFSRGEQGTIKFTLSAEPVLAGIDGIEPTTGDFGEELTKAMDQNSLPAAKLIEGLNDAMMMANREIRQSVKRAVAEKQSSQ